MWDTFKQHFITWTHRLNIINQWCLSSLLLTEKIMSVTFTVNGEIYFGQKDYSVDRLEVDLMNTRLLYMWHRMLCILNLIRYDSKPSIDECSMFHNGRDGIKLLKRGSEN
jgi:hypothetical protein